MIKIISNKNINHNEIPLGYFMFVFGHPKVGKTTNLSRWSDKGSEGVLLLDSDIGATYIDGVNRIIITSLYPPMRIVLDKSGKPVKDNKGKTMLEPIPPDQRGGVYLNGENAGEPMPTYSLIEAIEYLEQEAGKEDFPFQTIVLDTFDAICDFKIQEIEEEQGSAYGTAAYGADRGKLKSATRTIINTFFRTLKPKGINLIFVSHAKDKVMFEGSGKGAKATVQLSSTLETSVANILSSAAEIIGYVSINPNTDIAEISFNNSDEQHIGSRIKALSGKVIPFRYEVFKKEIEEYKGE